MAAKQAMKVNLQCTSKYGHLRISHDICQVRMTDVIEGFLTIYGHSDNLLNNKTKYSYGRFNVTLKAQLVWHSRFAVSFEAVVKKKLPPKAQNKNYLAHRSSRILQN